MKKIILIFIICIFYLIPIGFVVSLLASSNSQPAIYPTENNTVINVPESTSENFTHKYEIIRIPQTYGLKPGESGVTPETPYDTALPLKLSNIPYVEGTMYGDSLATTLQDIIDVNKGKDIVISYGDTYCGACIGVTKIFGDFNTTYGDIVKFISILENDPDRISLLIDKYVLNPDVIFVSNISSSNKYHKEVLQGYMMIPIVVHINPEGAVDRVAIGSFKSVETLKNFMGIDIR